MPEHYSSPDQAPVIDEDRITFEVIDLDICDDCGKPFDCKCNSNGLCTCGKACTCDQDTEVYTRYQKELRERRESGMSRCNDGVYGGTGENFIPIREIAGYDEKTGEPFYSSESDQAYLGGHTFRDDTTNQLIRAVSEVTGVPEELCALAVLFTFSSAIGKGLEVSFKRSEKTPLGIYILAFAISGGGKSKMALALCKALTDLHNKLREEWEKGTKPRLLARKSLLETKVSRLKKQYEKSDEADIEKHTQSPRGITEHRA
jgi:Protein of unknown function (DUF3987)